MVSALPAPVNCGQTGPAVRSLVLSTPTAAPYLAPGMSRPTGMVWSVLVRPSPEARPERHLMSSVAIARPQPLVLGDLIARSGGRAAHAVRDVLLVVGAAGLVGALAQVSIHLSFTPVPITGQTLGVLLAGTALGWRRAAAAMALY